jgi:hypothetical protein
MTLYTSQKIPQESGSNSATQSQASEQTSLTILCPSHRDSRCWDTASNIAQVFEKNGSTAAAHTGFPLNVGRVRKHYKKQATNSAHNGKIEDDVEYSTHQPNHRERYRDSAPGVSGDLVTSAEDLDDDKMPPAMVNGARVNELERNVVKIRVELARVIARQDEANARQDATDERMAESEAMLNGGEELPDENNTLTGGGMC